MKYEYLLFEIKTELIKAFGDLIVKVVLFGSRTDDTYREYSDYDILVVLAEPVDWRIKDRMLDIMADINIRNEILIDAHIISEQELGTIKGRQPFIERAMSTGISV
jgi:predicted nucleotidyltransferase